MNVVVVRIQIMVMVNMLMMMMLIIKIMTTTFSSSTTFGSLWSNNIASSSFAFASAFASASSSTAAFTTTGRRTTTTTKRRTRTTTIQHHQQQSRITTTTKTKTTLLSQQQQQQNQDQQQQQQQQQSSSSSSSESSSKKYYTYLNQDDTDKIRKIGGHKADTYGEMTLQGFQQWLTEYPLSCSRRRKHTFLDLGSGKGSLVVHALSLGLFTSSIGVELSTERHYDALQLVEESISNGILAREEAEQNIQLICGDISDPIVVKPLLENQATVIWCSNLLFGNELQSKIASLISSISETTDNNNSQIEMIATLKEFPFPLKGYELQKQKLWLEMSWTANKQLPGHPPLPGHPCCIYLRKVK